MHHTLLYYLTLWKPLGYGIVFLGMIFEGDAMLFTAAFLAREGFFRPSTTVAVAFAGVLLGDLFWYRLGAAADHSLPRIRQWATRLAAPLDSRLEDRSFHCFLLSKFIFIGHAVIARAGMVRMPTRKFLRSDIPATLMWMAAVGLLGYFSSISLELLRRYVRLAELGLLFSLALFFLVLSIAKQYWRRVL
ncbi:MAG: VTT domain-containing protein [Candidatus Sungbacteria bacterium]|nr:VTT domain-containing protein [Candidatus Sungbacteria bacterium]